jgi:rubrerythrin
MEEGFSQEDVIKTALQLEQISKAFYETAAQKATDPAMVEIFQFCVNDENGHIDIFQKIYDEMKCGSVKLDAAKPEDLRYLESLVKSYIAQGADRAINLVKTASTPLEVINYAVDLERDGMLFFLKLYRLVCEKDRSLISKLIKDEERHVFKLTELQYKLKQLPEAKTGIFG